MEGRNVHVDNEATPSLYDRLGGIYNIATVVDDFIDRIMVDDRLNANPHVDEAHHRVSPPGSSTLLPKWLGRPVGGHSDIRGVRWEIRIGI